MHAVFGTVLWIVCGAGFLAAIAALVTGRKTWEDFGKSQLVLDHDASPAPRPGSGAALLERDTEIRQLLEARNARRLRRGEGPIDVEAELARLTARHTDSEATRLTAPHVDSEAARFTAPHIDSELRAEIRDLVIARNHRRARQGKPPLDVESEIEREIASLGNQTLGSTPYG